MRARDLMTPDPYVVTPEEPVCRAAEIMREVDVGVVPVVDNPTHMRLCGVITDRDIAIRCVAALRGPDTPVQHYMTTGPLDTVSPTARLDEILERMKDDQVRRVMVVDGKRLVGVISQADLARHRGHVDPREVEKVIERISEPTHAHAHAHA
jgi:CBS domain-containing protein